MESVYTIGLTMCNENYLYILSQSWKSRKCFHTCWWQSMHPHILHQAIKQGVPYLRMCLGGQLLVKAFGAEVKKLPKYHISFIEIHFSEDGKKDPLYQDFETFQLAFQWHEDCFMLPEGAVSLAHHSQGFNQAFRYGERAYGLQYHCELTEERKPAFPNRSST